MTVFVLRWPDAVGRVWIKSQLLADFAFPVTVVPSMTLKKRKEKRWMEWWLMLQLAAAVLLISFSVVWLGNVTSLTWFGFLMLWFDFWFVVGDFSCMNLSFLGQFGQ